MSDFLKASPVAFVMMHPSEWPTRTIPLSASCRGPSRLGPSPMSVIRTLLYTVLCYTHFGIFPILNVNNKPLKSRFGSVLHKSVV